MSHSFATPWTAAFYAPLSMGFPSVQFSRSVVSDSATPWTAALQASLSITNSRSSLKFMSIESVMPSNHLILCRPLLLLLLLGCSVNAIPAHIPKVPWVFAAPCPVCLSRFLEEKMGLEESEWSASIRDPRTRVQSTEDPLSRVAEWFRGGCLAGKAENASFAGTCQERSCENSTTHMVHVTCRAALPAEQLQGDGRLALTCRGFRGWRPTRGGVRHG